MPALIWRTNPARSMRRCHTICASAGVSFKVGRKYWLRRMSGGVHIVGLRANLGNRAGQGKPRWRQGPFLPHNVGKSTTWGEAMIDSIFKLNENKTTIRTEVLAGITTFLTMAYIIFVNPDILSKAGMPRDAVFAATCIAAAVGCALMGFLANYPIA